MGVPTDFSKTWLLARFEVADSDEEPSPASIRAAREDHKPLLEMVPSPVAMIGSAIEPQHRVIQVSLGAEHGVLLTDAGITCTWGDNRYGQLGRPPTMKEENGKPFPVLDLQEEEVTSVAAGKHHCLALTAAGHVKAWGRNKAGQLGVGHKRDKMEPQWVLKSAPPEGRNDLGVRLGQPDDKDKNQRIIAISAGGNSSICSAANSDVWQWGEISREFEQGGQEKKKKKENTDKVNPDLPLLVAAKGTNGLQSYRTQLRKERISITEHDCRVLDKDQAGNRVKELVEEMRRMQRLIAKDKEDLVKALKTRGSKSDDQTDQDRGDLGNLQDTAAMVERDIANLDRDIDLLQKNILSCEQQQNHNMRQIEALMHQGTRLTEQQGKYEKELLDAKSDRGKDKKKVEDKLAEIKDFVEANQNTRATLLDQRAETDKEKQRLASQLKTKRRERADLGKRLTTVQELMGSTSNVIGASDHSVGFLGREAREMSTYFENKRIPQEYVSAKQRLAHDERFLGGVEARAEEFISSQPNNPRAQQIKAMLDDLVTLRRHLIDINGDQFYKDDVRLDGLFDSQRKANKGGANSTALAVMS